MGEEISNTSRFTKTDFHRFKQRLQEETQLITRWFNEGHFSETSHVGGLELEAWLVDQHYQPTPINEPFLQQINHPKIVPELAKFNIELNVDPQELCGKGIGKLHKELVQISTLCQENLEHFSALMVMSGILPTVRHAHLVPANMSKMNRYKALNEQVLRARKGRPLLIEISGREKVKSEHKDVMLESAATSFQLHLQVPESQAKRYLNASMILSAPMVAVAANSPYFLARDLWDETRIPLFEQAVEVGGYEGAARGPVRRVTFGSHYVQRSVLECFLENLEHYPPLLPIQFEGPAEQLCHLRLHNGTIWRWNRPLVGFNANGQPHLRIEHRVMPAGPTVVDMMANATFFYGLVENLVRSDEPAELKIPFSTTKDNFYQAARTGLNASTIWFNNEKGAISELILKELLPRSRQGLEQLEVDRDDMEYYLKIIEDRVVSGQNGACWQRRFIEKYGRDFTALTQAYLENQTSEQPVHLWSI